MGADVYVGTVEGYPEIDSVVKRLKERDVKKVHLMPLMLVAGDHAQNDMAGDEEDSWKTIIESEGIETEVHLKHSAYPAIEYYFRDMGADVYVGTVEGYPEIDSVVKRLKERDVKKVHLMPLMLVAGDHAQNDMAGDEEDSWKTIIESEGIETEVHLKGLGEIEKIQQKFVQHALEAEEV